MSVTWSFFAALLMAVAVVLGAFGSHALKDRLGEDQRRWWETGSRYHMVHGLALFAVDLVSLLSAQSSALFAAAGWLFIVGTVLFSGSLYAMALTSKRKLGMITPIGGLCWIAAWLCLAGAAWAV